MKITPSETTQVQVRCGGQMHKIEVKKNGAIALLSHPFLTTADREVNRALSTLPLEDRPRCFEVLNAWKETVKRDGSNTYAADMPIKLRNLCKELERARNKERGYTKREVREQDVRSMVSQGVNRCIRDAFVRFLDTVEMPGYYRPTMLIHYDDQSVRLNFVQRPTKEMNSQHTFDRWVNLREWFAIFRLGLAKPARDTIAVGKRFGSPAEGAISLNTISFRDGRLADNELTIVIPKTVAERTTALPT